MVFVPQQFKLATDAVHFQTGVVELVFARLRILFKVLDVVGCCHEIVSEKSEQRKRKDLGTLGQNLPFASFAAVTLRDLVSKLFEQVLHFCSPLSLGELVACSQGRGPTVRRRGVRGVRLSSHAAMVLLLQGMVVSPWHIR